MEFNKINSNLLNSFPNAVLVIDKNLNIHFNNKKFKYIKTGSLEEYLSSTNINAIKSNLGKDTSSYTSILSESYNDKQFFIKMTLSFFENDFYTLFLKDITQYHRKSIISKCCFSISEAIYNSNDLDTLYKEIHLAVTEITNTDNFYISIVDWNVNKIEFPYYIDKHDSMPKTRSFKNGLTEHVINTGNSLLLNNKSYNNFIKEHSIKIKGKKPYNWLGVPLKLNNNKTIGMIGVQSYNKNNNLTEEDLNLLNLVSNQIATAIKRKKDDIFIHKQAHYDALTGLTNKTLFYDRLDHAILQAQRHDEVISVLFLDIDDFKNINDTLGHSAGDEILKEIARIIKDSVRKSDTVSRWGGDEFCILLPSVKDNECVIKLCQRILSSNFKNIKIFNKTLNVNASIGVSFYPMDGTKAEILIDNADKAMYKAKKNGKNQYSIFSKKQ